MVSVRVYAYFWRRRADGGAGSPSRHTALTGRCAVQQSAARVAKLAVCSAVGSSSVRHRSPNLTEGNVNLRDDQIYAQNAE